MLKPIEAHQRRAWPCPRALVPTAHPALALIFAVLAVACGRAAGPAGEAPAVQERPDFVEATAYGLGEEPKRGGIAVIGHRGDPPSAWDPMVAGTITLGQVSGSLTGGGNLLRLCREDVNKVCPFLAESWQANPDNSEFTLKIRDGVKWHDGQPFTVDDVKFWMDLLYFGYRSGDKVRGPSPRLKPEAGNVKQVEVVGRDRIKATLEEPDVLWPARLAHVASNNGPGTVWHPKHLMLPELEKGNTKVAPLDVGFVGVGPFKMLKYEKGSLVQVRRFDGYWEKDEQGRPLPFLDGVDFAIINDPTAMDAAFRTGRLDGTSRGSGFYLTQERYDAIKKTLGDRVWFARIFGNVWGMKFNVLRRSPIQDVRVRRAIALWVDKQEAVQAHTGGDCCGMLSPGNDPSSPWVNPDWKTWPGFNPATRDKDRAEAKRLLQESGFAGASVLHMCRRQWLFTCEMVQSDLSSLGLNPTLDLVDDADWRCRDTAGEYDVQTTPPGWTFRPGIGPEEREGHLARASVNPLSTLKHDDPKIEGFFGQFRAAHGNLEQRVKIWREMERYLALDQVLAVPTWTERAVIAYRTHLKGLWVPSSQLASNMDMATVWLDK